MNQDNIWCVAIFKHGKAAIIEQNIKTYTLANSKAKKAALRPELIGALVKAVKITELVAIFKKLKRFDDLLTLEELLKLK